MIVYELVLLIKCFEQLQVNITNFCIFIAEKYICSFSHQLYDDNDTDGFRFGKLDHGFDYSSYDNSLLCNQHFLCIKILYTNHVKLNILKATTISSHSLAHFLYFDSGLVNLYLRWWTTIKDKKE